MSAEKRVAVVTGATGGIGGAITQSLFEAGYKVYGISRRQAESPYFTHVIGDVTDADAMKKIIGGIVSEEKGVDLLVCNAGFGISGAIEFTEYSDIKDQLEANLMGVINTAMAAVPHMRQRKKGAIIAIGSVAGILSIPFQAFYSVSKFGINGFMLALQNELRSFNIGVSVIMPGDVKTGFTGARRKNMAGQEVYPALARSVGMMEKDEQNGMPPKAVAKKVVAVADKKRPKAQYVVGVKYKLFALLAKLLPVRLVNWIVGKLYA